MKSNHFFLTVIVLFGYRRQFKLFVEIKNLSVESREDSKRTP